MKFYILHETHSDLDLNDHEAIETEESAIELLNKVKMRIDAFNEIKQVYCDEESEYFVEVDDYQTIRLYITEHQL
jgi:hypothetical protein